MTLDQLVQQGYITSLPVDRRKVDGTLSLARRDIATAKILLKQDTDWAFSIAYNAILQTVRAFMFSKGYRPVGGNTYVSVVRFAELYLEKDVVIIFDRMRRKRHALVYDTAGTISKNETELAITTAEKVLFDIEQRIRKNKIS